VQSLQCPGSVRLVKMDNLRNHDVLLARMRLVLAAGVKRAR
jgi:hypothetical protein